MRRRAMLEALVAGVNAAAQPHVPGTTLKPWGATAKIEVPGLRYTSYSLPWSENTEQVQGTVSGWIRGATLAETVVAAIVAELHSDRWRTYRGLYWKALFGGVRIDPDEEPGVTRFDIDFDLEMVRETADRY